MQIRIQHQVRELISSPSNFNIHAEDRGSVNVVPRLSCRNRESTEKQLDRIKPTTDSMEVAG